MKNYYVTFGIKYSREAHPKLGIVDPDGYIRIIAESEMAAREIASEYIGQYYSTIYPEDRFTPHYYPLGLMMTIHQDQMPVFDVWIWAQHIVALRNSR